MRVIFLTVLLSSATFAQDEIPVRVVMIREFDPAFRADVMKLLQVSGAEDAMRSGLPKEEDLKKSEARMAELLPTVDPEFVREWGRRMRKRIEVDYIELAVNAYQRHFTREEVVALIRLSIAKFEGKISTSTPDLEKRISSVMPIIGRELEREIVELSERMGGEVAIEIGREHPEYADQAARSPALPKPAK